MKTVNSCYYSRNTTETIVKICHAWIQGNVVRLGLNHIYKPNSNYPRPFKWKTAIPFFQQKFASLT